MCLFCVLHIHSLLFVGCSLGPPIVPAVFCYCFLYYNILYYEYSVITFSVKVIATHFLPRGPGRRDMPEAVLVSDLRYWMLL